MDWLKSPQGQLRLALFAAGFGLVMVVFFGMAWWDGRQVRQLMLLLFALVFTLGSVARVWLFSRGPGGRGTAARRR